MPFYQWYEMPYFFNTVMEYFVHTLGIFIFISNNLIWFEYCNPPGAKLVLLNNIGWYCDIANDKFKYSHEIIVIKTEESVNFVASWFIKDKLPQTMLYRITCQKIEHTKCIPEVTCGLFIIFRWFSVWRPDWHSY